MKRSIYYFMAVLFTASVSLGFTSCDDDDDNGDSGSSVVSSDGKITGKLQIIDYDYESDTYKIVAPVTNQVDKIEFTLDDEDYNYSEQHYSLGKFSVNNGEFTASLGTPPSQFLSSLSDFAQRGITVSNRDAKVADIYDIIPLKNGDKVGYIGFQSLDESVYVSFTYVDKDVSITGSYRDYDEYYDETYIEEYNVHLKKGWNTVVGTSSESRDGNTETTKWAANNVPNNVVWCVDLYYSSDYYSSELRSGKVKKPRSFGLFRK